LGGVQCTAVTSAGIRSRLRTSGDLFFCSRPMFVIASINEIIAVPATRTIRGLPTEVVLTPEDGMPAACALNFGHVSMGSHRSGDSHLGRRALARRGARLADRLRLRWLRAHDRSRCRCCPATRHGSPACGLRAGPYSCPARQAPCGGPEALPDSKALERTRPPHSRHSPNNVTQHRRDMERATARSSQKQAHRSLSLWGIEPRCAR